ncbi:MAG: hypothetical protein HY521_15340 [Proteobacteria bacterium]|nr:hypothetical protein [Pseudomonadota bacterium]
MPPQPQAAPAPQPQPPVAPKAGAPALVKPVQVDALAGVDPDSLGLLGPGEGGLGADLWRGTDRATVRTLLSALPEQLASRTAQTLARRLLLTSAAAPEGEGERLIGLRLERLARLGHLEDAERLLDLVPGRERDQGLARRHFDDLFLLDRTPEACRLAEPTLQLYDDPYWRKLMSFCLALAGQTEAALLTARLLGEDGHQDVTFFALLDALARRAKAGPLEAPEPLYLAMARAAEVEVAPALVERAGPAVQRSVALASRAVDEVRLKAAFRAEAAGALPGPALAELLAKAAFTREDFAQPFTRAKAEPPFRGLALLFQAAQAQPVRTARAEVALAILTEAARLGVFPGIARALAPLLKAIEPSPELLWFAAEAARALYAAGLPAEATAWRELALQKARYGGDPDQLHLRTWPLARLAGPFAQGEDALGKTFDDWRALMTKENPEDGTRRAAQFLALVEALGGAGAPAQGQSDLWRGLLARPLVEAAELPSAAAWHALADALAAKRKGEALLLAIIALGADGPASTHPVALAAVLTTLRSFGLEAEARALAVEAALAAGL